MRSQHAARPAAAAHRGNKYMYVRTRSRRRRHAIRNRSPSSLIAFFTANLESAALSPAQQTCNNHGGHRARICCSALRAAGRPHCARAAPVQQYHSGAPRARYAPHAPPSHASSTTSYCAIAGHAAKLLTSACCATAPARPPMLSARAARAATPLRSSAHDPRTALSLVPCTKHIMLLC
jgi:hypothetical protein